jgi:hypothetical protein
LAAAAVTAVGIASATAPIVASAAVPHTGSPTLLVYSAQGYDKNTVAAFEKATGIKTSLVDDSTGPLLARIQAEKADPQWGLLWVDGATAFAGLDQQGLLMKGFEPSVQWNSLGTAARRAVEGPGRHERPVPVRADLPVHRRHDELPRRRQPGRELLHPAQVQRPGHQPDQRPGRPARHAERTPGRSC